MARFTCPNCSATLHAATDVMHVTIERLPDSHTVGSLGLCGDLDESEAVSAEG
jgi:hypothetical protein